VVRAKQNKLDEAEPYFKRAYSVISKGIGALSPEGQTAVDELLQVLMNKRDTLGKMLDWVVNAPNPRSTALHHRLSRITKDQLMINVVSGRNT
jgi:hypothetical protein